MAEAALKTTAVAVRPIKSGAPVLGIVPTSIEEVVRLAKGIEAASLAPKGLDTWPKIMAVIMGGAELGLPPMQSLQSFALINNRLAIWGDAIPALLRSHKFKIKEWLEGEGDERTAFCEVTRPDTGEVIGAQFSVADAKQAALWTKDGPWKQYPRRMLQMRARAWAARDGAADVLRGVQIREEVMDYGARDVTAPAEQLALEYAEEGVIEIVDGTPQIAATAHPEPVDAKPEASGLKTVPKTAFVTGWAQTWRDRFALAKTPAELPGLEAAWNSSDNERARARVGREDEAVLGAVGAEYDDRVAALSAMEGVG